MDIKKTLKERDKRYGSFKSHAEITQKLKRVMHSTSKWQSISDDKKECLEMIAHKIGRILNGQNSYLDSWVDIAGYTTLIMKELERENGTKK